jgi:hypothetical protein
MKVIEEIDGQRRAIAKRSDGCRFAGRMHRGDHAGARLHSRDLGRLVLDGLAAATPATVHAGGRTVKMTLVEDH